MTEQIKEFGRTAVSLARNPLGIIALFIVLIYGFAALVVGLSGSLSSSERIIIVWFLAIFPFSVLAVFGWLVSQHHKKLYGPHDFKDESNFISSAKPELELLPQIRRVIENVQIKNSNIGSEILDNSIDVDGRETETSQNNIKEARVEDEPSSEEFQENITAISPADRKKHRADIYRKNRGFFLVHSYEHSSKSGQDFDIFIYLIRHKNKGYSDVEKAEFFLGRFWGNNVFPGQKTESLIGIRTSAYGPFLCTCRVVFSDGEEVLLHRYIDFEMAPALEEN